MMTTRIHFGNTERKKFVAITQLLNFVIYQSYLQTITLLAHYHVARTIIHCLQLFDDRVLVVRFDVGCPYILCTVWKDKRAWKRWFKDVRRNS